MEMGLISTYLQTDITCYKLQDRRREHDHHHHVEMGWYDGEVEVKVAISVQRMCGII